MLISGPIRVALAALRVNKLRTSRAEGRGVAAALCVNGGRVPAGTQFFVALPVARSSV